MKEQIRKIREMKTADAYFLSSVENVGYVTGFSGDSSELLITGESVYFFTDSRYTLQAQKDITDAEIEIITTGRDDRITEIAKRIRDTRASVLGIEKAAVNLEMFGKYEQAFAVKEYTDISESMLRLREVKTEQELELIRAAAKGNEIVLEELTKHIHIGVSELDVRAELVYQIMKLGMDSAFEPIVAGGMNGAAPHATVTDYRLKSGDLLTIDFGCKYQGYCSDITRTFGLGNIDVKLKKIYDIVKEAQQKALAAAEDTAKAAEIDRAAREVIVHGGYGEYFGHGTGHGVGREIHELPVLNPKSEDFIEKNMVYTIEPGIYVPGTGGVRIEDMCIGGEGCVYTYPKELILLQ